MSMSIQNRDVRYMRNLIEMYGTWVDYVKISLDSQRIAVAINRGSTQFLPAVAFFDKLGNLLSYKSYLSGRTSQIWRSLNLMQIGNENGRYYIYHIMSITEMPSVEYNTWNLNRGFRVFKLDPM
jgi:hypothetical protein